MFKRFWQSINEWADALSMDDPRGYYVFSLEDRVANLEREVGGLHIRLRMPAGSPWTVSIYCNLERRWFGEGVAI